MLLIAVDAVYMEGVTAGFEHRANRWILQFLSGIWCNHVIWRCFLVFRAIEKWLKHQAWWSSISAFRCFWLLQNPSYSILRRFV